MAALGAVAFCSTEDRAAVRQFDCVELSGCDKAFESLIERVKSAAEAFSQDPELEYALPTVRSIGMPGQVIDDFLLDFMRELALMIVVLSGHDDKDRTICARLICF